MKRFRYSWLLVGLCLTLLVATIPGSVEAKGKKNKKESKQKFEKRDVSPEQLAELQERYREAVVAERRRMSQTAERRIEREYEAHLETGSPYVRDILIISGGGAKGAFGAGFLQGWGTVKQGPNVRPEFDVVSGVSTGALIAPFAFVGTEETYTSVVDFYANPEKNWIKKRGALSILPKHVSLYNDYNLQQKIKASVDQSLVQAMADAAAEDRMLQIGTTNIDMGIGRIFELGHESAAAIEAGSLDRVHSILLASSAIPGVFPPVIMDDLYYVDGGVVANLTLFVGKTFFQDWREAHPDIPVPKYRIWIVVNEQMRLEPGVTQPRWLSVAGRALGTVTHTLELFAMQLLHEFAAEAREGGVDIEFRWVAIPDDAPQKKKGDDMFDKDYMVQMEELGRKMGADPSVWKSELPSAYSFDDD